MTLQKTADELQCRRKFTSVNRKDDFVKNEDFCRQTECSHRQAATYSHSYSSWDLKF